MFLLLSVLCLVKPPPPKVTLTQQEPLEIEWLSFCDELQFSAGTCDVRYRIDTNPVWSKVIFFPLTVGTVS